MGESKTIYFSLEPNKKLEYLKFISKRYIICHDFDSPIRPSGTFPCWEGLQAAYSLQDTMTVILRHATANDLDDLVNLENTCFTSDKIPRRNFRDLLAKSTVDILIAEIDNKIIGCTIIFYRNNSFKARIYSLAVHPLHRRFGIAYRLLKQAEELALKRHCTLIVLEVRTDNHPAISFYQKNGYEAFSRYANFYEDGADALRMKKGIYDQRNNPNQ
jgi:ribosomal-protein-alanine acetyltransferase